MISCRLCGSTTRRLATTPAFLARENICKDCSVPFIGHGKGHGNKKKVQFLFEVHCIKRLEKEAKRTRSGWVRPCKCGREGIAFVNYLPCCSECLREYHLAEFPPDPKKQGAVRVHREGEYHWTHYSDLPGWFGAGFVIISS